MPADQLALAAWQVGIRRPARAGRLFRLRSAMETLFDLDALAPAIPKQPPTAVAPHAKKIAARATPQTKVASDVIGAWTRASRLSPHASCLDGIFVQCSSLAAHRVINAIQRPDGDLLLCVEDEDQRTVTLSAARITNDGVLVDVSGQEFVTGEMIPAVDAALTEQAYHAGPGWDILVLTGVKGEWGRFKTWRGQQERVARLSSVFVLPPGLVPNAGQPTEDEVLHRLSSIEIEQLEKEVAEVVGRRLGCSTIQDAHELIAREQGRPHFNFLDLEELSNEKRRILQLLLPLFQWEVQTQEWNGTAELSIEPFNWTIEINATHLPTNQKVLAAIHIRKPETNALTAIHPETRVQCAVDALAARLAEQQVPPPAPPPSTKRKKFRVERISDEALNAFAAMVEMLQHHAATDAQRAAADQAAASLAIGLTAEGVDAASQQLSAAFRDRIERLANEAARTLSVRHWDAEVFCAAQALVREADSFACIDAYVSESMFTLRQVVEDAVTLPQVVEVAPGWWAALVCSGTERGLHGCVSVSGYFSMYGSCTDTLTPETAAKHLFDATVRLEPYSRVTELDGLRAWLKTLPLALDINVIERISSLILEQIALGAIRPILPRVLALLEDTNTSRDQAVPIMEVLQRYTCRFSDAREFEMAQTAARLLTGRFGVFVPAQQPQEQDLFGGSDEEEGHPDDTADPDAVDRDIDESAGE